jgi:acyl-CoA thioesterase-1
MKKFLVALLLFIFTLPVLAENTILIIGDSLSAGYGLESSRGWVKLLEQRLVSENYNYQVINSSISGDTLSNGLERLPSVLAQYNPTITIIELGGNDGLRGLQLNVIENNLTKMIALIRKAGSKVLLLGIRLPPNYGAAYTEQFHQLFISVAKENDVALVPLFLKGVDDNPKLMQFDGIHPGVEAQEILLNNVWGELIKMLGTR